MMSDRKPEYLSYGRALAPGEIAYLACFPVWTVVLAFLGFGFLSDGGTVSFVIGLPLVAAALLSLRRTSAAVAALSQGRPALIVTRDYVEYAPMLGGIVRRDLCDLAHFEVTSAKDTWPNYNGRGTIYALRAKPMASDQPGLEINSFGLARDRAAVIRMADDIAALRSPGDAKNAAYAAYAAKRDQEDAFNKQLFRQYKWFVLWFWAFTFGSITLAMWLVGR